VAMTRAKNTLCLVTSAFLHPQQNATAIAMSTLRAAGSCLKACSTLRFNSRPRSTRSDSRSHCHSRVDMAGQLRALWQ